MKRFFYSHPLFSLICLVTLLLLPSVGLFVPLFLSFFGIELENFVNLVFMLGGPLLTLLLILPFACFPSLKHLDEILHELSLLKCARRVFHAPQAAPTIEATRAKIAQNLEKRRMQKTDAIPLAASVVACEGIWMKDVTFRPKYGSNVHSAFYLLYTVDRLDATAWDSLRQELDRQLLALEGASLSRGCKKPAYAICVLCNDADPTVTEQVQKIQSYKITDAHVCVGIIPRNDWYLPAYKVAGDHDPTVLARKTLGKGTFGLRFSTFPYKGNNEYTDEFYQRVERLSAARPKSKTVDRHKR